MVELIPGRKYKILALDIQDGYVANDMASKIVGKVFEFISETIYSMSFYGCILRKGDGFKAEQMPPAEAEAYTMPDGESHYITMDPRQLPHGIVVPRETPPPHLKDIPTHNKIEMACDKLKHMLQEKNRKYGDSALSSGIAFDIPATTAIKARINDKLARLKNDNKDEDEDIIEDLLGYFILLKIANGKY